MLLGDVVDELHDEDRLADAGAAEQADLAALGVRRDQVDDLDAGLEDLGGGFLLVVCGRGTVDRPALLRLGGRHIVNRLAQQVENAAQRCVADGHGDRAAGVDGLCAAHKAVRAGHGDAARHVVADVLRHFQRDGPVAVLNGDRVQKLREFPVCEPDVKHGSDDLDDRADIVLAHKQTPSVNVGQAFAPPTISVISCVIAP